jgi:hypothetical protein
MRVGRTGVSPGCEGVKDGAVGLMPLWLLSIMLVLGTSGSTTFYAPEGANGVTFESGRTALIGL